MTDIFNYDPTTGAYLNTTQARLDPLEQQPLVPAYATLIAPPQAGPDEIAVWDGASWSVAPNLRGTTYWMPDGSQHEITAVGEAMPDSALTAPPPLSFDRLRANALASVDRDHATLLRQLTGDATREEADTWMPKALAAEAYLARTATPLQTTMIEDEAAGDGIPAADFVQIVVGKSTAFHIIVGKAGGARRGARAAIAAATTEPEINAARAAFADALADVATTITTQFPAIT